MIECEVIDLEPENAMAKRGEILVSELPTFFGQAFHQVAAVIQDQGAVATGPPFGYYPRMPTETVVVEAGFPVAVPLEVSDEVHPLVLPGGPAVVAEHVGPYEAMAQTYAELQSWIADHGLQAGESVWEVYLTDPDAEPDQNKWRTRIVWSLRSTP